MLREIDAWQRELLCKIYVNTIKLIGNYTKTTSQTSRRFSLLGTIWINKNLCCVYVWGCHSSLFQHQLVDYCLPTSDTNSYQLLFQFKDSSATNCTCRSWRRNRKKKGRPGNSSRKRRRPPRHHLPRKPRRINEFTSFLFKTVAEWILLNKRCWTIFSII